MRCRPGIVTNAESAKVPDLRRTANALHRVRDTSQRRAQKLHSRDARAPELCPPPRTEKIRLRRKGRRSAERRMCQSCPRSSDKRRRLPMLSARLRAALGGAPAFRRFTAALANGFYPDGSAPEPGFRKTRRAGVLPMRRMTSCVKHAPCGPVLLPVDRYPRAARERIAFTSARGDRIPQPSSESALAKGALGASGFCIRNLNEDNCQVASLYWQHIRVRPLTHKIGQCFCSSSFATAALINSKTSGVTGTVCAVCGSAQASCCIFLSFSFTS